MTLTFPLPPSSLRANARIASHWRTNAKAKAEYDRACDDVIRKAGPWGEDAGGYPHHMTVTVYLGVGQWCDTSDVGTWAKCAIDRLVAAKVFAGDSWRHINPFTAVVTDEDRQHSRLEISW